ncbi:type II toxin-antitoxin system VapC family toxin [Candidatus Daviesbacteria bacterium]|nr:type II toxin-antitoxin system VapC family toxin [Candidatus Daviesbacteria bacterium]
MKIVVDSSIIIDYLRGGKKWDDFISAVEAEQDARLFLPTIVIFELFSGTSTKSNKKLREMIYFISQFERIDLNEQIARLAGELSRDAGHRIQAPDYIIAASALHINASVVTLNQKHFAQIPHLSIYPATSVTEYS